MNLEEQRSMLPKSNAEKRGRTPAGRTLFYVGLSALALSACTATIDSRGYIPDESLVSQVLPGVDNRESVQRTLGFPTSTASFDGYTWYYISRRTENFLFFDESLIDQTVVEIQFDADGNVVEVSRHSVEDARELTTVARETETGGRKLGFFEQLFGNLGRYGNRGVGYSDPFENTGI